MKRLWIAAALVVFAGIGGGQAQDYPTRTVTVIVPFAARRTSRRDGPDRIRHLFPPSRSVHSWSRMSAAPAARSGRLRAARARPDGYTLISGHMGTNALAPVFYPNLGYDPEKDFEPVGLDRRAAGTACRSQGHPANNLKEFVAYAKANQSKLNMGHAGVGSVSYIGCLLLNSTIGIKPTHGAIHRHGAGDERHSRRQDRLRL